MNNIRGLTFEELVQGLSLEEDVRERLLSRREEGEKNFHETAIAFARAVEELPEVERALGRLRELESEGADQLRAKAPSTPSSIGVVGVSVGKRNVLRAGVRVTSTVTERPVEETLKLREEKVHVEEKRADRKLSPEEAEKAFEEKTLELAETAEEAVISKEARVVGEVSLSKTASEREETVKTKARRTNVKVEGIDAEEVKRRKQ